MIRSIAFLAVSALLAFDVYGQQDTPIDWNHDGFNIFIAGGGGSALSQSASLNTFRALMPESVLLNEDFSDFRNNTSSSSGYQNGFSIGAWLPAGTRADGTQRNGRFLVGISYVSYQPMGVSLSRSTRTRIDTLVSPTTGNSLFVDSLHSRHLHADAQFYALGLDVGYMFHSKWDSRWMAYGGAIVSVGAIIQSNVSVSIYENNSTSPALNSSSSEGGWMGGGQEREVQNLSAGFSAAFQTPIGIDFRLSRMHPFWSNLSLFTEWRPSLRVGAVSGVDTQLTPGLITMFGLRIRGF